MRIYKTITKRKNVLIFYSRILSTLYLCGNVWSSVLSIFKWILGLLKKANTEAGTNAM